MIWSIRCGKSENYINDKDIEFTKEYKVFYKHVNDTDHIKLYVNGKTTSTNEHYLIRLHCYKGILGFFVFISAIWDIILIFTIIIFIVQKINKYCIQSRRIRQ